MNHICIKTFCESYTLSGFINEPKCYNNQQNPSCIDLIFTNNFKIQNSCVMETGLSDFHMMTVTVMTETKNC